MLKGYSLRFLMDNCTTVGPPLSPPFNFTQESIVGNIIEHNLDWSSPFTWSDFPITNYTINVHNHLSSDSITITKSINDSTYSYITNRRGCYELDFSLAAINRIGQSEPVFIRTGHPIGTHAKSNLVLHSFNSYTI